MGIPFGANAQQVAEHIERSERVRVASGPALEVATLRDLFAAFALVGIIASDGNPHVIGKKWAAATAYNMADAMLARRADNE